MRTILEKLRQSPLGARVAPFLVFIALTQGQSMFGEGARYGCYLAKTLLGAWLLWWVRQAVPEMRWKITWPALLVGVGVFVMWVGIDPWYPGTDQLLDRLKGVFSSAPPAKASPATPWNPLLYFGAGTAMAWLMVGVRIAGSTLVVPFLEEVFYRSFLYRYIAKPDFASLPLGTFQWVPFLLTSIIFGFTHQQWLAGILCGFAYQGLVCWKKRLDDAIVAHAITNLLLGLYVVKTGAWQFW
jgi:uncharacterized protein